MNSYTGQVLQWLTLWVMLGLALRLVAGNATRRGRNHDR